MAKDVIRCSDCDRNISEEVKVYYEGKVKCQTCNLKPTA